MARCPSSDTLDQSVGNVQNHESFSNSSGENIGPTSLPGQNIDVSQEEEEEDPLVPPGSPSDDGQSYGEKTPFATPSGKKSPVIIPSTFLGKTSPFPSSSSGKTSLSTTTTAPSRLLVPNVPQFARIETRTGSTDVPRLNLAIGELQALLDQEDDCPVPRTWHSTITSGSRGAHIHSLNHFWTRSPAPTWKQLKQFVCLGFDLEADPTLQAFECVNLHPHTNETVEEYCTRWITGVLITIPDIAEQSQYLVKSLIAKIATHYGLPDTAEVLCATTAMLQLRSSNNPVMELHKLQKQLSQLALSKSYSQGPARRSAAVPIHRASLAINEVCQRFLRNRCKFSAETCDRLHVLPRSRDQPDPLRLMQSTGSRADCRAFRAGRCSYGERCRYRHPPPEGQSELGPRPPPVSTSDPAAKRPRIDDIQSLN